MTVTLCLYCSPDVQPEALGPLPRSFCDGPLGRVWPPLPHLVSSCLEFYWQLHQGFPRSPSVGCDLPYHITSLTLWESDGNCFGGLPSAPSVGCGLPYRIWSLLSGSLLATASRVSEVPLGRVWPSLPHLVSNPLGVCWQLLRGFSECPLGRVWPSLPLLVSTVWKSAGNCFGTPNSTELNNNSRPHDRQLDL